MALSLFVHSTKGWRKLLSAVFFSTEFGGGGKAGGTCRQGKARACNDWRLFGREYKCAFPFLEPVTCFCFEFKIALFTGFCLLREQIWHSVIGKPLSLKPGIVNQREERSNHSRLTNGSSLFLMRNFAMSSHLSAGSPNKQVTNNYRPAKFTYGAFHGKFQFKSNIQHIQKLRPGLIFLSSPRLSEIKLQCRGLVTHVTPPTNVIAWQAYTVFLQGDVSYCPRVVYIQNCLHQTNGRSSGHNQEVFIS